MKLYKREYDEFMLILSERARSHWHLHWQPETWVANLLASSICILFGCSDGGQVEDGVCDAVALVVLENSKKETLRSNDWIQRQEAKI